MKLWQIVIILHVLCGRPAFIGAETVHEVAEGGNIRVGCPFSWNGHTKIFCKNDCDKEDDILVQTSENEACNRSYCIDYKVNVWYSADVMYVNITKVNRNDSGRYQCVLKRSLIKNGIHEFEIKVANRSNGPLNPSYNLKPEPNVTKPTADTSPSVQTGDVSFISLKTTQQSFTQEPVSHHSSTSSERQQPPNPSGTLLYLGAILIAIIVLSSAALFIFFRKKKSKDPPVRAERESVQEPHRLYEEIPDRGSPPVEMLTIYATASAIRPTKDQPSDVYSLATASTNHLEAEDLTYSEVNYSNNSDCPQSWTTVYSAVQAQPDHSNYSTVLPPQQ